MIAVILPCYKTKALVLDVIREIPESVAKIYVVDDHCPEKTGEWVAENLSDPRIEVLYHEQNKGVGGAVITAFRRAIAEDFQWVVKLDSDGQMNPKLIEKFLRPLINGEADYTKGNRFFNIEDTKQMPLTRLLGNAGLSFLTKLSSGYWSIMDPTNGYFAINVKVLKQLPLDKLANRFYFESDLLFRLNTIRAVVKDIPIPARYGDEQSNLSVLKSFFQFFYLNINRFNKRIFYNYFLRDFNPASLFFVFGFCALIFSLIFGGLKWKESIEYSLFASGGTVMLAALPIILGFQMLLSAFQYDISNEPRIPVHPQL